VGQTFKNKTKETQGFIRRWLSQLDIGSEKWTLTTKDKRRLESAEMSFFFETCGGSNTSRPKQK